MESLYWSLIEPYWDKIEIHEGPDALWTSVKEIPSTATFMFAAHFCLSEIRNGGILQLFSNSTGILTPIAIEAYRMIGMDLLAAVLETAAAPLGTPFPLDREARQDAMLQASSLSDEAIRDLFATEEHFYIAFDKATKSLIPTC